MPIEIAAAEMSFISPAYAGIFGFILVFLSWRVVSLRNKYQVRMGDGGHSELTAATRAQDNLLEYLPTALLLLLMIEFLGFSPWIVHALGLLLLFARLLHLKGMRDPSGASVRRKVGTRITWLQLALTSGLCIAGAFGYSF